jgi:hypothetical protein
MMATAVLVKNKVVDPSTVGTSTTTIATDTPFQWKDFYDPVNGYHWVLYSDGTGIVFQGSKDGSTNWTAVAYVPSAAVGIGEGDWFSLWFDGSYVHLVYTVSGGKLQYCRGTPGAGTIVWGAGYDVDWSTFVDEGGEEKQAVYLTKNTLYGGNPPDICLLGANPAGQDWTTVINTNGSLGGYFMFMPYLTNALPLGSLPATCQRYGWEYGVISPLGALKLSSLDGRFIVTAYVKNTGSVNISNSILYARLWTSPAKDFSSGTVALSPWTGVTFSLAAGSSTTLTINIDVNNAAGSGSAFSQTYFYVEFCFYNLPTNIVIALEANSGISGVAAPLDGDTYPSICVDSSGYPAISWGRYLNGIGRIYPYVAKASAKDGTWSFYNSSYWKLNQLGPTSAAYAATEILPLTVGKLIVLVRSFYSNQFWSYFWNGAGWFESGNDSAISTQNLTAWSAIAENGIDTVDLVFLEKSTLKIQHYQWTYSSTNWALIATVATGSSSAYPALAVDPSTNNLYCFMHSNHASGGDLTADYIYYKIFSAGSWGALQTWINETANWLLSANNLSCYRQAISNIIGILYEAYQAQRQSSPYNVRYAFLSLAPPVYVPTPAFLKTPVSTVYISG